MERDNGVLDKAQYCPYAEGGGQRFNVQISYSGSEAITGGYCVG